MTDVGQIRVDKMGQCWVKITRFLFFVVTVILLSLLCFFFRTVEIKRPLILLAAAGFALLNFKRSSDLSLIQRIVLLYILEMQFNQLSLQFIHIRVRYSNITVSLGFIALVPLGAAFVFGKLQARKIVNKEATDLLRSWAGIFAIIATHMLLLFLLLRNFYGYGYEHDFGVLATMCLYVVVFLFSWEQLEDKHLQRITAIVSAAFFAAMILIKG